MGKPVYGHFLHTHTHTHTGFCELQGHFSPNQSVGVLGGHPFPLALQRWGGYQKICFEPYITDFTSEFVYTQHNV